VEEFSCRAEQSRNIERSIFGKVEWKKNRIDLKVGVEEKLELMLLADKLDISFSLLIRLLIKQAVLVDKMGENPLSTFNNFKQG
jgi:hypothetical protein